MPSIDLNCDMGESFGAWQLGSDAAIMPFVTSANIACGFHAGDPTTIRKTIELALALNVAVGAHPSYPDLQGFGRRQMSITPEEVFDIVLYQVSALKGITESLGGCLHHVKAHGALYNQAAKDASLAAAIARAVAAVDKNLIFFGLAGSQMLAEAERFGLKTASEVFADRTYQADGTLTPRSQPGALIEDTDKAVAQVMQMINDKAVTASTGETILIDADTVCIHGDGSHAVDFARALNAKLRENRIELKSFEAV